MSRVDVVVTIYGSRLRETDKAVQFRIDSIGPDELDYPKTEWLPFSQCKRSMTHSANPDTPIETDYLVVTEWILKQKGLL
jgi:hypothetical protein